MEKSKAIELLKLAVPIKALTQQEYSDFVEAVNMAIDALEQPTSPDTIDRQAAINALQKCRKHCIDPFDSYHIDIQDAENQLWKVPTIQPEKEQLSREGTTKDTISRQAALEKVRAMQTYKLFMGDDMILVDKAEVQTELMMLPSAQPEPKEGHWIRRDCGLDVECKCSRCGYKDFVEPRDEYWFNRNFCPNCGAKMKGAKHETN